MNSISNAIAALLYDHEAVIVPGLGAFLRHAEGAKVNVITNQFEKPSVTLSFDPQQREENELLVNYFVTHEEVSEEEAKKLLAMFVSDCFAKLRAGGTVVVPEVGTLSFDGNQELVFTPVDAPDFNGDAFGLSNLNPQPVYGSEQQEDWKAQVTRQIKDKNIPMTVAIDHDDKERGKGWIWVLLLLLVAGGVALWYFKFRPVPPKPMPPKPIDTPVVPMDTMDVPLDTVEIPLDTLEIPDSLMIPVNPVEPLENSEEKVDTVAEPVPSVKVVLPEATSKAFIVGGCFSIEQNALNMTTDALEQGCVNAFVMRWGSMYYVCYDQFATLEEAKAALGEVLEKYNKKAWILQK